MILSENEIRVLIRTAIAESIKRNNSKTGKGLGMEYLYALLQPALIDMGNLEMTKIELPSHYTQEEWVYPEDELKDKGAEIRKKPSTMKYDVYDADFVQNNLDPAEDLKIK
jgi:hypothetical protein